MDIDAYRVIKRLNKKLPSVIKNKPPFEEYDVMEEYPYVYSAIRIYAQEILQVNPDTGRIYEVEASKRALEAIEEFEERGFLHYLNFIVHNTCKYGEFAVVLLDEDTVSFLAPTDYVYDQEAGRLILTKPVDGEVKEIGEDRFVRFAFYTDYRNFPYGTSILAPVRKIWRRLKILEDSLTVYRLTRATQRYVFYVYTGDLPPEEAIKYVNKIREQVKQNKAIDPRTGDISTSANFWDVQDDLWIPVGSDGREVRVDILQGAPNVADIADIDYFLSQFFGALNIPKAYIGHEYDVNRATLVMQDERFGRVIKSLQPYIAKAIARTLEKYLALKGIEERVKVNMYFPNISDMMRLEYLMQKADLLGSLAQIQLPDGKPLVSSEEIRKMWESGIGTRHKESEDVSPREVDGRTDI